MNICLVVFNYPLTLLVLLYKGDHWFYYVTILALIVNKFLMASASGKVRFLLQFPNYADWKHEYEAKLGEVSLMLEKERK